MEELTLSRYLTQADLDAHMASKPVQEELIAYFGANPTLFGGAPSIYTTFTLSAFARPEITKEDQPLVVFSIVESEEKETVGAHGKWANFTEDLRKTESGVLGYGAYADKDNEKSVKTLEIYSNEYAFEKVRKKSDASGVSGQKHVLLKPVAGYLGKETKSNL